MASKSDTPFKRIDTDPAYTSVASPQFHEDAPINGFDTETADGGIFALTVAWAGQNDAQFIENGGKFITKNQIWAVLTNRKARSSVNVWYNLNFDANVLLSHVLDEKELAELSTMGGVTTADGYEISYVPSKFLSITDPSGNSYKHFDVSQFFYAPLDEAAKEWLNTGKLDDVDTEQFGADDSGPYPLNDYIMENWFQIKKYAKRDAVLVRDLWEIAVETGETMDTPIPMGAPYSTGYLAESFLNHYLDDKPGIGPTPMASTAWNAYAGGRFEPFKRGDVGRVAGPDINSAYPWVLSELPDPSTLDWTKVKNPTHEQLQTADYGFVRATVTTDRSRQVQPFAVKMDDVVKYPVMDDGTTTTLVDIYNFAHEAGYIVDSDPHYAWLGSETPSTKYPFDFVESTYDRRKRFERNDRPKAGKLLKIVLNSMYGKTCQTTPKRRYQDGDERLESHERLIGELSIPEPMKDGLQDNIIERLEAGKWFNPFLAAYITGRTRLELHRRTVQYGLEDACVMLATDCAMYEADAFNTSGFRDELVADGLGNWDFDYEGDAFVIGAGVYEVDTGDELKTQTRGFREADLPGGLREAAADAGTDPIDIESMRPMTASEAVWSGAPMADIGAFIDASRELRADMDTKRQWPQTDSYKDLLDTVQVGNPLEFSGSAK